MGINQTRIYLTPCLSVLLYHPEQECTVEAEVKAQLEWWFDGEAKRHCLTPLTNLFINQLVLWLTWPRIM